MMALDPKRIFGRLSRDIPQPLHRHLFIVGSLAAAYHFRARLERRAVNTKDADMVVYPAGDVRSSKALARELLTAGWRRTPECWPVGKTSPAQELRAIRLYPPGSEDYFVELLGLPRRGQSGKVVWIPVHLPDGWYGVGCHRFMSLNAFRRLKSPEGLEYSSPAMMALANLLSHPGIGPERMGTPIQGRKILRSAKDLGRVLALAWLAGRDAAEGWLEDWVEGLRRCFPGSWRTLARNAGRGLQDLLANEDALEEARITIDVGLLNGRGVTVENLEAVGARVVADLVLPLAGRAGRRPT
jgi:hypothetical protein